MANRQTWATAQIEAPPAHRGGGTYTPRKFNLQSGQITWSWGSEAATGELTYIGAVPVTCGASVLINLAGNLFWGVCDSDNPIEGSGGKHRKLQFRDNRDFLDWDCVWGQFNLADETIVAGVRQKRYKHILPSNYGTLTVTYTNDPYSAKQIIRYLMGAPTTEDTWTCIFHKAQNQPVYEMVFDGEKLRSAIAKVSEAQGLVFTLKGGAFRLVWGRKGEGTLPTFQHFRLNNAKTAYDATPYFSLAPVQSDDRSDGFALSGNPTRITVCGDRTAYQIHDVPMTRDWLAIWEQFFDPSLFYEEIYRVGKLTAPLTLTAENGISFTFAPNTTFKAIGEKTVGSPAKFVDPDQIISRQLARAMALDMTIREYAALKGNVAFIDYRKFATRSRADMPCILYINQILFRAFRFPDGFGIKNAAGVFIPLNSLGLASKMVAKVTHDPTSGEMQWDETENADGNGYAIVKGYQVGTDLFRTIRPDRFDFAKWTDSQNVWEHIEFQIDDSGEADGKYVLFDQPVINSGDLVTMVNGYAVFKAKPTFNIPQVRIACTFLGERFRYVKGRGTRDDVENVAGLAAEYAGRYGSTTPPEELPFSDGSLATEKADEIADSLLEGQYIYQHGKYTRWIPKSVDGTYPLGTQLVPRIDRITFTFGTRGCNEDVELTKEAPRRTYIPERDLDRGAQMKQLLPGQAELRHQSNIARLTAAALRQSPKTGRTVAKAFTSVFGNYDPTELTTVTGDGSTIVSLPVGTPLQKKPSKFDPVKSETRVVLPSVSTDDHNEFAGVTIRDGESVPGEGNELTTQRTGDILVRVKGPCKAGDIVNLVTAKDYLSAESTKGAVGKALQDIADDTVKLIRVRTSSATAATVSGFPFEVIKTGDATAKVVLASYLFTGLDVKALQKIYGLNTEFTFAVPNAAVWLELLFDKNGALFLANICTAVSWDAPAYPKTVRSIKKTDDPLIGVSKITWTAPPAEKDANETLVNTKWAAWDTNTRHFKSWMLIGYLAEAKSAKGNPYVVATKTCTFVQCLKDNLLLTNFCENSLPVKYPILWTHPVLERLPNPVIDQAKLGDPVISIAVPGHPNALIYYTTNGSNPNERSTLFAGDVTMPGDTTVVKAIAYEDRFFESEIVTATPP